MGSQLGILPTTCGARRQVYRVHQKKFCVSWPAEMSQTLTRVYTGVVSLPCHAIYFCPILDFFLAFCHGRWYDGDPR